MVNWLVYHPRHQALVCKVHGHAILNLVNYLANKYKDINIKSWIAIITKYSGLQLSRPPNIYFNYSLKNPIPAINGLAVQKGFACNECKFIIISWKKLRIYHEKNKYTWVLSKRVSGYWSKVKLQTFFTILKNAIHYFCVIVFEARVKVEAEAADVVVDRRGRSQC